MQEIKLVMYLDDVAGAAEEGRKDYTLAKLFLHYNGRQEEIYARYLEAGIEEDDFFDHLVEKARTLMRKIPS